MKNNFFKSRYALAVVLTVAGVMLAFIKKEANNYFEVSKNIEIFTNLYKEINTYYVDETEPATLMRTGIDAMLKSLDPFTNYISEAEIEGFRISMTGRYGGIGAAIEKDGDLAVISELYEGFSAVKNGLKVGDVILSIDGKTTVGKTTDEISEVLKGSPGTSVSLAIKRKQPDGLFKPMNVQVEREKIVVPNVPYFGMVNEEIGYLTLTTFTEQAGQNVANAVQTLKKENPKLKGIIFDLRGNGGGLLNEAVTVSNVFIGRDELVVTTRGRIKEWDKSFSTRSDAVDLDIPLVLLTDKGSASASEIVSGVMQDLDRGVVLGQKSYGKGLVQNTMEVGYNARVKVTIAKYYVPSGRCIQSVQYKDGEPVEIPDSLKARFKTRRGREVLDGGGIYPDVPIAKADLANITKSLLDKRLIFDYATLFSMQNPSIADAKTFKLTDVDYDKFVGFVKNNKHNFETEVEKTLVELEKKAKTEKYLATVQGEINAMRQKIEQDKARDIYTHKAQIKKLLEREIVTRYYFEKGRVEYGLQNDEEVAEAIKVLQDAPRYRKILGQ